MKRSIPVLYVEWDFIYCKTCKGIYKHMLQQMLTKTDFYNLRKCLMLWKRYDNYSRLIRLQDWWQDFRSSMSQLDFIKNLQTDGNQKVQQLQLRLSTLHVTLDTNICYRILSFNETSLGWNMLFIIDLSNC